ncbi:hypothetical protein AZE42_11503 [Rhizopogon vesiculosus]|uniref:DUF4219 domain-containing protein n=1 Tax=Rhizopogon vesiculosus TaxID=180088 RepID=A0A1J8Q5K2_9AGAM|nr:hypothetical protein AZE42_11503 [Rhizopogon vesiculosus]
MSSENYKSTNSITKLTSSNYPTWKGEMKAYLCVKGLWRLVNGFKTCPSDADAKAKWDIKADKAADAVQDNPVKI